METCITEDEGPDVIQRFVDFETEELENSNLDKIGDMLVSEDIITIE